ncbi:MAG TPA: phosphate ABC transporter permease subunit PstC [Actinomycetota bacterium]|nr:phosphate ABC transporter permease subunit PstC [Actinomycetota bacterium]
MTEGTGRTARAPIDLGGDPRRRRREAFVRTALFSAALFSILISVGIVFALTGGAVEFLRRLGDLGLLLAPEGWIPRSNAFDVRAIFVGSVVVSLIAMLVAAPLGLGAAMYLSEFAGPRARRLLKPILETLASVPSVVMGFFALRFITPEVVKVLFPGAEFFNALAAGIGVGLLVTPLVASIAEDAMHAVPNALREASFGLGARRRATTMKVVLPAAVSGVVAALILGVSRAIGETMIVAIAAGGTSGTTLHLDPLVGTQTMTAAITALATGSDQVRGSGPAYYSFFFVGMLLFLMTLSLNLVSERYVRRVRRRYG